MSVRAVFVGLLCLAFLAPQGLGLHWHGASGQQHDHGSDIADAHVHTAADLAIELSLTHFDEHIVDGEFDLQPEISSPGKVPAVELLAILLALVFAVLAYRPARRSAWPPLRPPRLRLRARFLPPSHAPPHAA